MKTWGACRLCYLRDSRCENRERGMPCVPAEEEEKLHSHIKEANKLLADIAVLMSCDEAEIKEVLPDFCVDQEVLDKINAYFRKWGKDV